MTNGSHVACAADNTQLSHDGNVHSKIYVRYLTMLSGPEIEHCLYSSELQAFRVSFDYMWSLRNLDYGTEEYNTVMKEVW